MDLLACINVFVKVVESGSFAAAAVRLDMSRAMASKYVMHLEEHLGTRLLHRTTRKLSLTEQGRLYYERSTNALNELIEAQETIASAASVPTGKLRVNTTVTFGTNHLIPALAVYLERYPQVTVEVTLDDGRVDLVEDGYDLGVRAGAAGLMDSTLVAKQITSGYLVVCAAQSYIDRHGAPHSLEDLANHNCLLNVYASPNGEWHFGPPNDRRSVKVHGTLITNTMDAVHAAVRAGIGLGLLPTLTVGEDLSRGRLIPLLLQYEAVHVPFYAVYPSRRYLPAKVRTLLTSC